jgi:hypothetical protein
MEIMCSSKSTPPYRRPSLSHRPGAVALRSLMPLPIAVLCPHGTFAQPLSKAGTLKTGLDNRSAFTFTRAGKAHHRSQPNEASRQGS